MSLTSAQEPAAPVAQPRATAQGPPAAASMNLLRMLTAPWIAQAVYAVAELGLADELAGGPRTVIDLAAAVDADPDALYRIMRTLSAQGVFKETEPRLFELGELGGYLRSDVPGTQKYSALLFGAETFRSWGEVMHSVRTGKPAFEKVFSVSFYDYLASHEEIAGVFNQVMGAAGVVPPVAQTVDFGQYRSAVDVGGGTGALLGSLLRRWPNLSGTIFDLPEAIGQVDPELTAEMGARLTTVSGSFFAEIPGGGDVYLLSRVLHNWNDQDAAAILSGIRAAMKPAGRLLIFERFLPDDDSPHMGKLFDLVMLVMLGGRERTLREYGDLLATAGFETVLNVEGPRDMGLLEAKAA